MTRVLPTIKWIEEFATLTGSSLVPGVVPNDRDYFASLTLHKDKLEELYAMGPHQEYEWQSNGDSVCHWTDSLRFSLSIDDKPVHLFFVKDAYYRVLTIYTGTVKELTKEQLGCIMLASKDMRVLLCESLRRLQDSTGLLSDITQEEQS